MAARCVYAASSCEPMTARSRWMERSCSSRRCRASTWLSAARVLSRALEDFFRTGSTERLDRYSDVALRRIWKAVRYSTYMTNLLHRYDTHTPFDRKIQVTELDYISSSEAMQKALAENYVGLPFEDQ